MPGDEGGVTVPLSLFSSLITELSPPDLPEGASPDNQDIVYLPGSVGSRPGVTRQLSVPLPGTPTPTIVYLKTYVQQNGNPLTLILDSNGVLWQEDVVNSPGTVTQIGSDLFGEVAQSVSMFGREYLGISDGLHGAQVPLQYDATYLDRVSQDGPGAPPAVADDSATYTITAPPTGLIPGDLNPNTLATQAGTLVTIAFTSTETANARAAQLVALAQNQTTNQLLVQVSGVSLTGYNGLFAVASLSYVGTAGTLTYIAPAVGGTGTGGTVQFNVVNVNLSAPINAVDFQPGQISLNIAGASDPGYNVGSALLLGQEASLASLYIIGPTSHGAAGNGTLSFVGTISAGAHQLCVMFLTRQGYLTKASPTTAWTAAGNLRAILESIPIGPPNVVARVLAFTGAGGDNFFTLLASSAIPQPSGPPIITQSLVIPDNTTTSISVSFNDNSLFAGNAIDIQGQNQFAQVVLGPILGFFGYGSRTFAWGEYNKIQNTLNMGFEGGYLSGVLTQPLGWTVLTAGGILVTGGAWASGQSWRISGLGSGIRGQIAQPAYQDEEGIAILQPSTQYTFRAWLEASAAGARGDLIAQFYSPSVGILATATIHVVDMNAPGSPEPNFLAADFDLATPAEIPPDTIFQIYTNGLDFGAQVTVDEVMLYPTLNPYLNNRMKGSYVNGPEQFDGVTGIIGPEDDPSPIRNLVEIRNVIYINTQNGKHQTSDNGTTEPAQWNVPEVSQVPGALSVHATDPGKSGTGDSGEQWEFLATPGGLYIFYGGETLKVSQEIQPLWDRINWEVQHTVWVKNDYVARRCYVGVPLDTSTAPSNILVLDYRELNDALAIANNGPVRESFSGKMIAKEFCRKWTIWNLPMNCAEILTRGNNKLQIQFGVGNAGAPSPSVGGFGQIYWLNSGQFTDDDFGQIVPYWTTYFFVSHDQEQQLQLDSHRKLMTYLTAFISGVGQTNVTPLSNTLANAYPALPAYPLNPNQNYDYEWDTNVDGNRIAVKVGSIPAEGQTDNSFVLSKLTMTLKPNPMSPMRGAL